MQQNGRYQNGQALDGSLMHKWGNVSHHNENWDMAVRLQKAVQILPRPRMSAAKILVVVQATKPFFQATAEHLSMALIVPVRKHVC